MELKEKTPHTILDEIIEAAKECGQVMLQADRANFGIKDKAGKANFVTKYDCKIQEMLEKKLSELLPEAEFLGGGMIEDRTFSLFRCILQNNRMGSLFS